MDAFKKSFRTNVPSLIPLVDESFRPILQLPFLHSLDELLKVWDKSIQVHLPDLRDEASSVDTDSLHAKSFYGQGMGLLFNNAQELSPLLTEWLDLIRKSLGLLDAPHEVNVERFYIPVVRRY